MAVSPITPQMMDVQGQPITVAVTYTSTAANVEVLTLPTYMPKIDLSRAHPVLNILILSTEDDSGSTSIVYPSASEQDRGTTPTGVNEFEITSDSTIEVWQGATDKDGIAFITYIPAGVQNA